MVFGIITLIGFMLMLAVVCMTMIYFLTKALVKHESERIDPIPEKRY
jgi:hypothetical protein